MPRDHLDKPNYVNRPFTLQGGKLTFMTGDAAMVQRLKADKKAKRASALVLLSADTTDSEFTGTVERVEILNTDRPQQWQVVVVEHGAKPRKRV